ncbi:MAG: PD40 domain-containing protein [Phycisphaerales bacterium]|nr:MAG: PD40 domain-containing protein [Phycisphaerales bacterium]
MSISSNRKTIARWIGGICAVVVIGMCAVLYGTSRPVRPTEPCPLLERRPTIRPDYTDAVLPPNIAPLNFVVEEDASDCFVRLHAAQGEPIEVTGKGRKIVIPQGPWHRLIAANRGSTLSIDVFIRTPEGAKGQTNQWQRFQTIVNTIATEPTDDYLVYRRIHPGHATWRKIGVYQRDLRSFREKTILDNEQFREGCVNCHTFCNHRTDKMLLGIRSTHYGSSAILVDGRDARQIPTKFGYTAWHPNGRLAAFSVNKVRQIFHAGTNEIRDVFDFDSLMAYYRTDTQAVETSPALSNKDRLETYPAWSPDGKYLYFCSAPLTWDNKETLPQEYDQIRYDLVRVSYDAKTDTWGDIETLVAAQETGQSALLPRISPDGRWLLLSMCDYGCFPVYRASSDLYLIDLEAAQETGRYECRRLDINSDASESWHSFSSNGRWIAFSSKRLSHAFTRTFLAYLDEQGRVHKPILLPQKDPLYYDSCLWTFSVPELVTEPVRVSSRALARAVRDKDARAIRMPVTMATPQADSGSPYTEPLRE